MVGNPGCSLQMTPCGPVTTEHNELNFRNLYLHHNPLGPNRTQTTVVWSNPETGLGETVINNWPIHDGPDPCACGTTVVARAQGLHVLAGGWHNSFTITFEDAKFKGSTLQVMGLSLEEGEWSIVGGTGQFAMARGIIYKRMHSQGNDGIVIELTIHGFCEVPRGSRNPGSQKYPMYNRPTTKNGPWGGYGGARRDVTDTPQRLESITIRSGSVIDSLSFSYINQDGERRTAGPWGGIGGHETTIHFAPSEFITEVSGTTGSYKIRTVVRTLKIVTNLRTYGPFGGEKPQCIIQPYSCKGNVVGFFGRSGDYLDSIGTYTV